MSQSPGFLESRFGRTAALVTAVVVIGVAAFVAISLLQSAPTTAQPSGSASPSAPIEASPEATATPPLTFTSDEGIVQVLVEKLPMRAQPADDGVTLTELAMGQLALATGRGSEVDGNVWIEIRQEPSERVGWVAVASSDGTPALAVVHDGAIGVTSGSDAELFDLTTAQRTALTSGMSIHELAFSPDGEHVALLDPFRGAAVVSIDTTTTPEPTPEPTGGVIGPPAMLHPTFAPNGEVVAYLVGQDFLGLSLLVLGEGPPPTFATPPTVYPVSWAPDSRHIASSTTVSPPGSNVENWEIVVSEEGATKPVRLTRRAGTDASPAWSPDGSTIAYLQQLNAGTLALALVDADGNNQRRVLTLDGFPSSGGFAMQPAWSPDGSHIAIAQSIEGQSAVIHLVDVHTSEHLTISAPVGECADLTWSPTGSHIAFVCTNDFVASNAYAVEVGYTNVMTLGPAWHVDWARTLGPLNIPSSQ